MAALNREGAWVRSYSGYHHAHLARRRRRSARPARRSGSARRCRKLDLKRTFGTTDRQAALDALRQMWTPMMKRATISTTAGRSRSRSIRTSPSGPRRRRELHFKSGKDWRDYNEQYGVPNADAHGGAVASIGARRTALMKEFGTRPARPLSSDMGIHQGRAAAARASGRRRETHRARASGSTRRSADAAAKARSRAEWPRSEQIAASVGKSQDFKEWSSSLRNRFAQIDGSARSRSTARSANVVVQLDGDPAHVEARPRGADPLRLAADQGGGGALLGHSVPGALSFAVSRLTQGVEG